MQRAKPIIVECMKKLNPNSVLDLGCGKCKFSKLFIDRGIDVTGVDREKTIESKDNLTFIHKDIKDFEFEKNYDLVIGTGILHFLKRDEAHQMINKIKENTLSNGFNFFICMSNEERFDDGIHFYPNKEELNKHIEQIKEAEKRDHRKLGKELDLFHTEEEVGIGLILWHPKGALIWRIIEDFWYKKHLENGYDLVRTPHIGNKKLWERSGHWGYYSGSMYPPLEVGQSLEEIQQGKKVNESEQFLLKPMNCPFHVSIYNNLPRSYKELPFRWAEAGTVYRFEKKGELSGLTRVRGFTQDDAHIICRKDQVEDELKKVIDFILFIYKSFGFDANSVKVYLSLRNEQDKEKYAGNDEGWDFSESILRKVATEKNLNFIEEKGEAAFYGPKLDFKIKDVLGREWQCSTLQFDFNLPERFNMSFTNSDGEKEQPYMLHRALFGSFERFIGLLIEHYAGAFPFWLSPVQIEIIPVGESHREYAREIAEKLKEYRVKIDEDNETIGKKIRAGEMEKIPYLIVVGDKEVENKTLSVRQRGKIDLGEMTIEDFSKIEK